VAPVRAGVDGQFHQVLRGVCVVRFKAITVLLGAVIASSFPVSAKFGPADAADAVPAPARPQVNVPEFVPVVNFSEFVLAMETFAAQNPAAARVAAEALSAKFALNSGSQQIELHTPTQHAVAQPAIPPTVIVTRPVVVADVPAVPDPHSHPPKVADPVKIVTGYSEERPAPRRRHKTEKTASATTSRARVEKRFEPAMGLGMTIESAEEAPPMSSLTQKKSKVNAESQVDEW
jgi:hypothetical protein